MHKINFFGVVLFVFVICFINYPSIPKRYYVTPLGNPIYFEYEGNDIGVGTLSFL